MNLFVGRRFPYYDAALRLPQACDVVRSKLNGSGDRFELQRKKRGIHRVLQPRISGSIAANPLGGCDVRFRVAFPSLWWTIDIALFIALIYELIASTSVQRPVLLLGLTILVVITFFSLWVKGTVFARHLSALLE